MTSTEGRYEGMGQYVECERIVRKKAEPQPKDAWEGSSRKHVACTRWLRN